MIKIYAFKESGRRLLIEKLEIDFVQFYASLIAGANF